MIYVQREERSLLHEKMERKPPSSFKSGALCIVETAKICFVFDLKYESMSSI